MLRRRPGAWFSQSCASLRVVAVGLPVLLLLGLLALPSGAAASSVGSGNTPRLLAFDNYHRDVRRGLGRAPRGGRYRVFASPGVHPYVGAGALRAPGLQPGRGMLATLPATHVRDVRVLSVVTIPQAVALRRSGFFFGVDLRRSGRHAYRAALQIVGHHARLRVVRITRAARRTLTVRSVPVWVRPGSRVVLNAQVVGTSRPRISVRAWVAGRGAPGWERTVVDRSRAAITTAGTIGFWGIESRRGGRAVFRQDLMRAVKLPSPGQNRIASGGSDGGPHPPVTPPTTPTAVPTPPVAAPTTPTTPVDAPTTPVSSNPASPVGQASARGAVAPGGASYPIPDDAIFVSPDGSDANAGTVASPLRTVVAAVDAASPGATIVLRAGTYHESVVVPARLAGLTIQAYPHEAVWFDGTTPVTQWRRSGSVWVHDGWNHPFDHSASFTAGKNYGAFIGPQNPMAAWPDGVWRDGEQLKQVAQASEVGLGSFAVDYGAQQLIVGSDPTGHDVRASDLGLALKVLAPGVTLRGFGVRRYATSLPTLGTVRLQGGQGTLQNLLVTQNATQGISFQQAGNTVEHVTSSDNGMVGIHANTADRLTVRDSVLSGNNAQQFNTSPSAAGIKITRSRDLVFDNNLFSQNAANGLWLDQSDVGITVVNNSFVGNYIGAQVELADTGVVANNSFDGGKYGLYLLDTGNIQIYNNSFAHTTLGSLWMWQDARRQSDPSDYAVDGDRRYPCGDPSDPWLLRNNVIANNAFESTTGLFQVWAQDKATNIPADAMNLEITGNRFAPVSSSGPKVAGWGAGDNHTIVQYRSVADFEVAPRGAWRNAQPTSVSATVDDVALPLPADVADAAGLPAGMRAIGPVRR